MCWTLADAEGGLERALVACARAAMIGTATEWLLHRVSGLPMAVGASLSAALMLLLFRRCKPFAPAMAISLVPMLLPDAVLPYFPLLAAVGSAYFIGVGMICYPYRPHGWRGR